MNPETPAETPETPAEDTQLKGTLLTPDQLTDWGNETRIVEPGVTTEDGQTVGDEELGVVEETEEETEETEEEEVQPEPVEPVTPAVTLTDPGEYKPNDYSFEITVYDSEGKNGKVTKINSIEQWNELLDRDANFGSGAALLKGERQASRMERNLEQDEKAYQAERAAYEAQVQAANEQNQTIARMESEINYLAGRGELPPISSELANADWQDPEISKQAGVKERVQLLNYMRDENKARTAAGLEPMRSVLDAHNAFLLDQRRNEDVSTRRAAAESRKIAGAKVAGSSPNPNLIAPKGVAVGDPNAWRRASFGDWS